MTTRRTFLGGVAAAPIIGLRSARAQSLDKISYQTNWRAQAEHGGFYQAVAPGLYKEHGLEVEVRQGGPQPDVHPPLLRIDKDAICQVLVNLLDNAVKYSGERKEIGVSIAVNAAEVRIAIRDRGIGIPSGEQKKIFEKFYRVGSTLVHDVKGSGLGLAIVKHVVHAHGGRVELASTPGDGSTFTIVLPVAQRDTVAVPTTEFA
jgi:signal transduction histidine kinase